MIITKYRMIVGKGYVETLSLEEVKSLGYEYEIVEEFIEDTKEDENNDQIVLYKGEK
jgi:hypothetical protein